MVLETNEECKNIKYVDKDTVNPEYYGLYSTPNVTCSVLFQHLIHIIWSQVPVKADALSSWSAGSISLLFLSEWIRVDLLHAAPLPLSDQQVQHTDRIGTTESTINTDPHQSSL